MNSEDLQVIKQSLTFLIYRGQPTFQICQEFKNYFHQNTKIQTQISHHSANLKEQLEFDKLQLSETVKFIQSKGGLYQAENYVQYLGDLLSAPVAKAFQIQLLNLRILKTFSAKNDLGKLLAQANSMKIFLSLLSTEQLLTGTYQQHELSTQIKFDNGKATLHSQEGVYKVGNNYQGWFGDHALVTCKDQSKFYLALINLKNNQVNEKWLGKTLSNYHNFAIQFNGSSVVQYVEITQEDLELISEWESHQGFEDCLVALRTLLKATDICYKYCSMRKQFRSTDDKSERTILTYQVTLTRLINALSFGILFYVSTAEARKEFYQDVGLKKPRRKISKKFVDFYSLYITETCTQIAESLRDVMGGFGFLKVSGMPQIQEKLIWLSSFYKSNRASKQQDYLEIILDVNKNQNIVLFYLGQYFMGNPESMFKELGPLTQVNVGNPFHVFGYHVAKIKEKLSQSELQKYPYSSFQFCQLTFELFASQKFFGLLAFRRYRSSNYILDRLLLNQNFVALAQMETNADYISLMKQQITQNDQELLPVLNILIDSLEFDHYGILLGQENQQEFYEKLINSCKNENQRNVHQTIQEIRKPVLDLLNRPGL